MTSDSLEPSGLKEQSKAPGSYPPGGPAKPASGATRPAVKGATAPTKPAKHSSARPQKPPRLAALYGVDMRIVGFAAAFFGGAVATLFLLSAVAVGFKGSYDSRILPGVRVGTIDLSGATRDEAIAKLTSGYSYLGHGEVTVTTPVGVTTITYQQVNRGPDVEAMADAAMSLGHSGNPINDAASVIHSAVFGQDIPVVIRLDPTALAQRLHDLVGSSTVPAQDAQATSRGGNFNITPAATGTGVDEVPIGSEILGKLTESNAPADLRAGGSFVTLQPRVDDTQAQDAIAFAGKMSVDLKITWKTPPNPLPAGWSPKNWTITADQIRSWIVFGVRDDGTYAPAVDPAQIQAYLASISGKANVPATKPSVIFEASGKPKTLRTGSNGVGIDIGATSTTIAAYLDSLATGGNVQASLEVVPAAITPEIKPVDVSKFVIIGQWTTTFFPGAANGNGANIRVPARNLNGQVVAPGQEFSFLRAVGTIDVAHGFAKGGVILNGQSDHTGAIGGGICSASTTMFDAAAKAGLQIDERHAHFYYISRYPIGRDATVYSNGSNTWDLRWTNDTSSPIVIRAWATKKSKSTITVQLWSMPTGRTVTWSGDNKANERNIVQAINNPPQYVTTLKPGKTYAVEVATNGFTVTVGRVVKDSTGKVIHSDIWKSQYTAVNGQLQIGSTPLPTPTPKPTPTPTLALIVPFLALGPVAVLIRRRRL
jgi:vancomycin resistance protein YoaR